MDTLKKIKKLKKETEIFRNELNSLIVLNDIKIRDTTILVKMGDYFQKIGEIFQKYDFKDLGEMIITSGEILDRILFDKLSYSVGMSVVLYLHELTEEIYELFWINGKISEELLTDFFSIRQMLEKYDEESSRHIQEIICASEQEQTRCDLPCDFEYEDIQQMDGTYKDLVIEFPEIVSEFINESNEFLDDCEQQFFIIEKDYSNTDALNTVFRSIHSIKGSALFLKLNEIGVLSHVFETALSRCREKTLSITVDAITLFFDAVDTIRKLLSNLILFTDNQKPVSPVKIQTIILRLQNFIETPVSQELEEIKNSSDKSLTAEIETLSSNATVRIPVKKIDDVTEIVGEMIIAISLLKQSEEFSQNTFVHISEKIETVDMIADLLQARVLKMRMFPVKNVYDRLLRQIRDLVKKSGKKVEFYTEGAQTEVDKTVIDEIYTPLSHIVRNCIDHGIELPDARIKGGKDSCGKITITTENRGNNVVITVSDDGEGLNTDNILKKALSQKIISANDLLTEQQIFNLIFLPGFSTAEKITEISGRGVGMDVVKKTIHQLGGSISVKSVVAQGTEFEITIPLSASIIDGLLVSVGKSVFIFSILKIKSSFIPESHQIYAVDGTGEVFTVWNNQVIPVIKLGEFYGIDDFKTEATGAVLLITEFHNSFYALMADEILYKQKIVTKTLENGIPDICGIRSGTILGNGNVGLIVEPEEIIQCFTEK